MTSGRERGERSEIQCKRYHDAWGQWQFREERAGRRSSQPAVVADATLPIRRWLSCRRAWAAGEPSFRSNRQSADAPAVGETGIAGCSSPGRVHCLHRARDILARINHTFREDFLVTERTEVGHRVHGGNHAVLLRGLCGWAPWPLWLGSVSSVTPALASFGYEFSRLAASFTRKLSPVLYPHRQGQKNRR